MNALPRRIAAAVVAAAAAGALLGGAAMASAAPVPAASSSAEVSVSGTLSAIAGDVLTVKTSADADVQIQRTGATKVQGSLSLHGLVTVKCHQVSGSLVADLIVAG
ncbi:hypothetical protein [Kutzneria sp. CA-103260]|uniref:hypothetical protein n=1 Tax=Kutzneria sp. CA-103260 TaxID=2802641 RepID=UPI001BA9D193|nr:hypothetical protein [Kutzneria sp. CA-103260]QUQ63594.1 hypothetical protein JJ691_13070 [Kutzneria sp. CA-103260]